MITGSHFSFFPHLCCPSSSSLPLLISHFLALFFFWTISIPTPVLWGLGFVGFKGLPEEPEPEPLTGLRRDE